ncbi:MAG TPA: hypothetical protein VGD64_13580 [Acidisarcina sp.]
MQQPNLFSSEKPPSLPSEGGRERLEASPSSRFPAADQLSGPDTARPHASTGTIWLRRLDLFLRVAVRLYLGLLLIALPWMHFWDENHFFTLYPSLGRFAESGAVRGIVSGLGFLNLWIAISEAFHYRDQEA